MKKARADVSNPNRIGLGASVLFLLFICKQAVLLVNSFPDLMDEMFRGAYQNRGAKSKDADEQFCFIRHGIPHLHTADTGLFVECTLPFI